MLVLAEEDMIVPAPALRAALPGPRLWLPGACHGEAVLRPDVATAIAAFLREEDGPTGETVLHPVK